MEKYLPFTKIKEEHYGIYHNQIYISTPKVIPQRNQCQKKDMTDWRSYLLFAY